MYWMFAILVMGFFSMFYGASRTEPIEATKVIFGVMVAVFLLIGLLSTQKQVFAKTEHHLLLVISQLIFFGGTCKFLISLWHEKLLSQHRSFSCMYFLVSFSLFIVLSQFGKHIPIFEPIVVDALKYLVAGFCSAFIGLILEKHRIDTTKVDQ